MKKINLFLCLLIGLNTTIVSTSTAQYNNTYYSTFNGNYASVNAIDIVTNDQTLANPTANVCVLGSAGNIVDLKLLDNTGAIVLENAYNFQQSSNDYVVPTKMIQTANGGFIVVGYYTTYLGSSPFLSYLMTNPFAARFNSSLNLVWYKTYQSNTDSSGIGSILSRVNIVRAVDDRTGEHYMMVGAGNTNGTTYSNSFVYNDMLVNALMIDGTGGGLIWNVKYALHGRNTTYNYMSYRRELPTALTYAEGPYYIDGRYMGIAHEYFIAGPTDQGIQSLGFRMAIDKYGSILMPYRENVVPSYAFFHDAIFDGDSSQIIMSYTLGANSLVSLPVVSEIGISKMDISMNYIKSKYFWDPYAIENYVYGIKKTLSGDGYITADWISFPTVNSYIAQNLALVKVDNALNPIFYDRYNVNAQTYNSGAVNGEVMSGIVDAPDLISGTETYIRPGNRLTGASNYDLRVISADITTGAACGDSTYNPGYDSIEYVDTVVAFDTIQLWGQNSMSAQQVNFHTTNTSCDPANDPRDYRQASPMVFKEASLKVYPTLFENDALNTLVLNVESDKTTRIEGQLFAVDGKLLGSQVFTVNQGSNTPSWNLPIKEPGSYILKFHSSETAFNKTVRISKL